MSADWAERKSVGDEHEQRVREELERRTWSAAPYGQGTFPVEICRILGRTDSLLRWGPDLIVARGSVLAGVDAKSSMRGDGARTYTLSRKALGAGLRWTAMYDLPLYYVFHNLGVATPAEVMQFCGLTTVGKAGGYVSFPCGLPRPFEDVFGGPAAGRGLTLAA